MNISIHEAWVVYYTMPTFSPSLAVDVMFTTMEEAETALVECQKEDQELKFIHANDMIKYHICTVAEWVYVKGQYEFRLGERTEREYNEPE